VRAVADKERKDEADEQEEEAEGEGSSDADEEESNEEGEGEGEQKAEEGAAAARVAKALGVAGDEEEGEAEAEEKAAPAPNRAERRREAALRRKKRGGAAVVAKDEGEDAAEPLPRDKNARAKELLKRRREQASGARPVQLLPGEMVDDALARTSSAVNKWLRANFSVLQWVILAALAAGGGYLFYSSQMEKTAAAASDELFAGVADDRGRVVADDKRSDEEKEADPTKVFKSGDERADAALAAYQKVVSDHAGTGAAILARLGEAGAYLDKHDWDKALKAYSAVAASTLAGADPDVKGRALEGEGFAKEGKGDLDGAVAAFKELEAVDLRGDKELGMYHEARIALGKGDKDKAKDLLKQVHDRLEQPTADGPPLRFLQAMADDALRRIDPTLVPAKAPVIGGAKGGAMTKEELEKAMRQLQENARKAAEKNPHEGKHE
jgi:hypothetical protein